LQRSNDTPLDQSEFDISRQSRIHNTQNNSPKMTEYQQRQTQTNTNESKTRFFKQRGSVQTAPRSNANAKYTAESSKQCNTSRISYFRGSRNSTNLTHQNRLTEKEQEREYMAFIANQRPILPALKDVIKSNIEESVNAATKQNAKSENV